VADGLSDDLVRVAKVLFLRYPDEHNRSMMDITKILAKAIEAKKGNFDAFYWSGSPYLHAF